MADKSNEDFIAEIRKFPAALEKTIKKLKPEELRYQYREGGWNIAQIVHHLADSHMHSYIRMKLAVSIDHPTILAYDENKWANMADAKSTDNISSSMNILKGVHDRWTTFLESLEDQEFNNTFLHPEHSKSYKISDSLKMYAEHGQHHLDQIKEALKNKIIDS